MRRHNRSSDGKRTRGQRPRTVSISLSNRGQTTQDFAIGIGVFLLSVAFVFSYLPSLTTPFDSSIGGAETAQADRIADRILYETSSSETPNEISGDEFEQYRGDESHELSDSLGIRADSDQEIAFDNINIRIEVFEGDTLEDRTVEADGNDLVAGAPYDGESAASSARIVTLGEDFDLDSEYEDEPAYRLVVRVW